MEVCKSCGVKMIKVLLVLVFFYLLLICFVVDKLVVCLVELILGVFVILVINNVDVIIESDFLCIKDVLIC